MAGLCLHYRTFFYKLHNPFVKKPSPQKTKLSKQNHREQKNVHQYVFLTASDEYYFENKIVVASVATIFLTKIAFVMKLNHKNKMSLIKLTITALFLLTAQYCVAQKYICKNGSTTFFSETPVENIEAKSSESSSAYDTKTGDVVIIIPIKSFQFEQSLMQEHFNENYLESDKYPKAFFKGKITEAASIDYSKDGTYKVNAQGKLTIHNVTKDVKIPGTISIKNGKINMDSKFTVRCADYAIKIPKLVMVKIAEEIQVTIANSYSPL